MPFSQVEISKPHAFLFVAKDEVDPLVQLAGYNLRLQSLLKIDISNILKNVFLIKMRVRNHHSVEADKFFWAVISPTGEHHI